MPKMIAGLLAIAVLTGCAPRVVDLYITRLDGSAVPKEGGPHLIRAFARCFEDPATSAEAARFCMHLEGYRFTLERPEGWSSAAPVSYNITRLDGSPVSKEGRPHLIRAVVRCSDAVAQSDEALRVCMHREGYQFAGWK